MTDKEQDNAGDICALKCAICGLQERSVDITRAQFVDILGVAEGLADLMLMILGKKP